MIGYGDLNLVDYTLPVTYGSQGRSIMTFKAEALGPPIKNYFLLVLIKQKMPHMLAKSSNIEFSHLR